MFHILKTVYSKVENVTIMNEADKAVFDKMLDEIENHTMYIFVNEYLATTSFFERTSCES